MGGLLGGEQCSACQIVVGAPCLDHRFQERLKNVETGADDLFG
jgi:hypothetical protein